MKYISILIILLNLAFNVIAETTKNNEELYQVKLLLISHNDLNYIKYEENFSSEKYNERKSIIIENNNCIIAKEHQCIKYDLDYKLDTFNEYKKILEKRRDYTVLSHLEWIQSSSKNHIKIKTGYDYSDEIFNEEVLINDIDILSSGAIKKYEGYVSISKNNFFNLELILYERIKMEASDIFSKDILVLKKFIISQKIKLNKVTYIDRDNFGLIVSVERIKNDI